MIKGIGTDIIELARLKKSEGKIAKRFLTETEFSEYKTRVNSLEFLAGRLAAKEACYKALSLEKVHFSSLEIKVKDNKTYYEDENNYVMISISHEKNYAIAYAISFQNNENTFKK